MAKKYMKLKIFLVILFTVFAVLLVTQVASFLKNSFNTINTKTGEFNCANIKYKLDYIQYTDNKLMLEVRGLEYNQNITSLTVVSDLDDSREFVFEPIIDGRESRAILLENISIESKYRYYINNCGDTTHEKEI